MIDVWQTVLASVSSNSGLVNPPVYKLIFFRKKYQIQNPVSDIWACYVVVDKNELKRPRDGGLIRKTGMCVYMGLD